VIFLVNFIFGITILNKLPFVLLHIQFIDDFRLSAPILDIPTLTPAIFYRAGAAHFLITQDKAFDVLYRRDLDMGKN
jgi:hypothetical protein